MLDGVERLLTLGSIGPMTAAGLVWFGVNYVWIGPEVATRLGDLRYQPACIALLEGGHRFQAGRQDRDRGRLRAPAQEALDLARQQARHAAEEMERTRQAIELLFGPVWNWIGRHTGNPNVGEAMRMLIPRPPPIPALRERGESAASPPPIFDDRASYCGCVVSSAVSDLRLDFAIYTSTLRIFVPDSIASFTARLPSPTGERLCGPAAGGQ